MAQPERPFPRWLRPLWVRILFCALAVLWAGFEAWMGSQTWSLGFLALAGYGVWSMIIKYQDPPA